MDKVDKLQSSIKDWYIRFKQNRKEYIAEILNKSLIPPFDQNQHQNNNKIKNVDENAYDIYNKCVNENKKDLSQCNEDHHTDTEYLNFDINPFWGEIEPSWYLLKALMSQEGSGTAKVVKEKLEREKTKKEVKIKLDELEGQDRLEREGRERGERLVNEVEIKAEVQVQVEVGMEGGVEGIGLANEVMNNEINLESTDIETLNQRNDIDIDSIEERTDNISSTYTESNSSTQSATTSILAENCVDISEVTRTLITLQENFLALNNTLNDLIIRLLNVENENKSLKSILSSLKIEEAEVRK